MIVNSTDSAPNKRRKMSVNVFDEDSDSDFDPSAMIKNENENKERLEAENEEYDTQQYLALVVNNIKNKCYVHPFNSKPTTLPKRRISKLMKLDPANFKISSVALELMAILIETFIRDLISRSFQFTLKDNRKILQLQDICRGVQCDAMYDFLIDAVPRIQSHEQHSNMVHFIYTSQIEHKIVPNNACYQTQKKDKLKTNKMRRSKRRKSKNSDKEEAD